MVVRVLSTYRLADESITRLSSLQKGFLFNKAKKLGLKIIISNGMIELLERHESLGLKSKEISVFWKSAFDQVSSDNKIPEIGLIKFTYCVRRKTHTRDKLTFFQKFFNKHSLPIGDGNSIYKEANVRHVIFGSIEDGCISVKVLNKEQKRIMNSISLDSTDIKFIRSERREFILNIPIQNILRIEF